MNDVQRTAERMRLERELWVQFFLAAAPAMLSDGREHGDLGLTAFNAGTFAHAALKEYRGRFPNDLQPEG